MYPCSLWPSFLFSLISISRSAPVLFGHLDHDHFTPDLFDHLLCFLGIFSSLSESLSPSILCRAPALFDHLLWPRRILTPGLCLFYAPHQGIHTFAIFSGVDLFSLCFLSFLWVATVSWVEIPYCVSRLSNLSSQCLCCLAVVRILWHLSKESADRARQIKMFKHYNALKWEVWWFSNFLIIQITHFIPWHHHDYWVILLIISILLVILPSSTLLSRPLVGWYLVPPNLTADAPIWLLRFTLQHCSVATAEHEDWQALESTCKISSNGWTRGQQNLSLYLVIQWRLNHNDKSNEMILIITIAEPFFLQKFSNGIDFFFNVPSLNNGISCDPYCGERGATNCLSCVIWFWQFLHTSSQFFWC